MNIDYVEQFLLEIKSYLPCLTQLRVSYDELTTVKTRRNCAKVKSFDLWKAVSIFERI
jgi:hypothetical protein